jgi:hypothetical protein
MVGVWIVDLISVSALVSLLSKIFNGTADKAGEDLWQSLTSFVRRLFGRNTTSVEAVKRLGERPGDPDAIRALAQALVDDTSRDPQAAAQLRHWVTAAQQSIAANESVTNTVSGEVRGNVLQARDIHGNITF